MIKYTDGKNRATTKMREALASKGGMLLIGVADRQTVQYRNSDRNQSKLAIFQAVNSSRLLSLNLCNAF